MSIIVSVYLKEGIVMSADSRLTGITPCKDGVRDQYTVSDNGQKLFLIKNGNIGISSCGDQTLDGKTIADFIRCFELEEVRSEDTVSDVANKLAAYVKGKHAGIVIFHVCGYVNSERFVYRIIDSDEQHDITSEIDVPGQCAAVWNGEPISTSPESFKGGGVWNVIVNINDGLKAVGYALLVLFFVMGVVKTCGSFTEMKKPEVAFKCFIRFVLAQAAVSWGMELMTGAFRVAQGMVTTIMDSSGLTAMSATTLPDELVSVIEDVGFIDSIPLWAVTLLGSLFIWVLSLVMILTVYSRFFKLYIATAIAPIPLASFAGQPSSSIGVAFLKSYAAICLEGCVIVLACVIFSAFASSPPAIADDTLAAATIVWNYVGELIFNMLVLVGAIKMSDRIIRELMGLG